MTEKLPYGAAEILELRKSRKRPAELILVSLIGPLREMNPVVIVRAGSPYDWRFLVGLDALLVATTKTTPSAIAGASRAILDQSPAYLGVWFADQQDGLNIAFGSWRPKSKAGRRMGFDDRRRLRGIGKQKV